MQFTHDLLFITRDSERTEYRARAKVEKNTIHWASRKLFFDKLTFLSLFWKVQEWRTTQQPAVQQMGIQQLQPAGELIKPQVVAVGVAPGGHIDLLAQFFPELTFQLYDSHEFLITENRPNQPNYNPNKAVINIYNQAFTDDL